MMSLAKPILLSITSWNVHGLSDKFSLGNKLSNDEVGGQRGGDGWS